MPPRERAKKLIASNSLARPRRPRERAEVVVEVRGQGVAPHKLTPEAGVVLEGHEDHTVVPEAFAICAKAGLRSLAKDRDFQPACRRVLRAEVDPKGQDE
eukprot:6505689-Heterocapsa_arctica.AAC.1